MTSLEGHSNWHDKSILMSHKISYIACTLFMDFAIHFLFVCKMAHGTT